MCIVIITGGTIEDKAVREYLKDRPVDHIIAVDGGVVAAERLSLYPDYIVGDFDTLPHKILEKYEQADGVTVRRFRPEKDDTDTQIAVELAVELAGNVGKTGSMPRTFSAGQDDIIVFGALGTRFDHALANVFLLEKFAESGFCACIIDGHNRISVHRGGFAMEKSAQYGKYVSFLALTPLVTGITLQGFRYPLVRHTLRQEDSLCISNEIVDAVGRVSFLDGLLLMVESKD